MFKDNDHNKVARTPGGPGAAGGANARVTATSAALRHNFVYQEWPLNRGGTLSGIATLVQAQRCSGHPAAPCRVAA